MLQWLGSWRKSHQSWKKEKHDRPEKVSNVEKNTDIVKNDRTSSCTLAI